MKKQTKWSKTKKINGTNYNYIGTYKKKNTAQKVAKTIKKENMKGTRARVISSKNIKKANISNQRHLGPIRNTVGNKKGKHAVYAKISWKGFI